MRRHQQMAEAHSNRQPSPTNNMRSTNRFVPMSEYLRDPELFAAPKLLTSGWQSWDDAQPLGATERGSISVLAAPPGCYKTATMLRLARGFAANGSSVTWLAAEMRPEGLVRRIMCQIAQVSSELLRGDELPPAESLRLDRAAEALSGVSERICIAGSPITVDDVESAAESSDVVFIDYLQLVHASHVELRGHERIEDVISRVASAAQRNSTSFIIASAQGRSAAHEQRDIHTATKGSSIIEYSADALYCASGIRTTKDGQEVEFKCLKQREGHRRTLVVCIDGRTGLITEEGNP